VTAQRLTEHVCWASGKRRYSTQQTAQAAADRQHGITLTAYKCRGCREWHLTGEGMPEQRRAR
jgi:type II secretory ATPase GspE/PulE/Tfp pilus assembly ATPase PilB-like protein